MRRKRLKEISHIYNAALELPESERAAFLETCEDEDLRQEVLSLLRDEDKAKSFLEEHALDVASRLKARTQPSLLGRRLGSFNLISMLGKGGMGEVYRAKDQKLGRDVAIKVLSEEFAQDDMRISRFQREAKLLASLNHPNISSIHGLEESDGIHFLVLELVEGDTLADRIKSGPIPVEESLKLALQITEALEAAHEKGVIHRDLKPANIKVTPDGKVKVLDFGLAKAFAGDSENINLSNSPTLSDAATQQGVILGTAAYMSPEQARGNPVDKRADIWAFGVVLFEMLTGRQVFSENTVSDTLASVLKTDPKWDSLPQNLHPRIRLMLERCLEKDVKSRSSGIGEVRADIDKVLADPSGVFAQTITAETAQKKLRTILPWVAAAIVVAGVVGWLLKPASPPEPRQVHRYPFNLQEGQKFGPHDSLLISKDGNKIAHEVNGQLYLRDTNNLTARPIQGVDENPSGSFLSPDGKWIGYFSPNDSQLKKIDVTSGTPVPICSTSYPIRGVSWEEDDTIVFSDGDSIKQVSAKGGTPKVIVKREEYESYSSPQILPDGKSILFTVGGGLLSLDNGRQRLGPQVAVQSLESGKRKILPLQGNSARYLPTGHIVYTVDNNLFAVAFDLDRLELIGDSVPMDEGVSQWAISDKGTLIYVPRTTQPRTTPPTAKFNLVWVDRQGKMEEIPVRPDDYASPRISPDGTKVAIAINAEGGSSDIYILDLDNETPRRRLTFENENSTDPLWTPDGERIVFIAGEGDEMGIYWKNENGTGEEELLTLVSDGGGPPWSLADNGKTLVTTKSSLGGMGRITGAMMMGMGLGPDGRRRGRGSGFGRAPDSEESSTSEEPPLSTDIGTLSMEGDHEWKSILQIEGIVTALQISPDGRWMAYSSPQSGILVRPFPDVNSGSQWQVSASPARGCLWSPPDGSELYYIAPRSNSPTADSAPKVNADLLAKMFGASASKIMAVIVETEPTFKSGKFNSNFKPIDIGVRPGGPFSQNFDISPVDKRFLMLKEVETAEDESRAEESTTEESTEDESRKYIVVTNWFEELKERVPVD
jgi:serine/threonine protein kinase